MKCFNSKVRFNIKMFIKIFEINPNYTVISAIVSPKEKKKGIYIKS